MPGVISVRSIEIRRPLKKKDEAYQECREVVMWWSFQVSGGGHDFGMFEWWESGQGWLSLNCDESFQSCLMCWCHADLMKLSLACASCSSIDLPARNGLYRMATPLVPQIFKKNVVYEGFCKNERWHMLTTFVSSPYKLQLILWHLCFPCVILFRAHLNYLVTYWITSLGEARWRGKPCFAMAFTQFVSLSWWVNTPYSKSKYESQQHLTLSNL
jgi:hypothetical protein